MPCAKEKFFSACLFFFLLALFSGCSGDHLRSITGPADAGGNGTAYDGLIGRTYEEEVANYTCTPAGGTATPSYRRKIVFTAQGAWLYGDRCSTDAPTLLSSGQYALDATQSTLTLYDGGIFTYLPGSPTPAPGTSPTPSPTSTPNPQSASLNWVWSGGGSAGDEAGVYTNGSNADPGSRSRATSWKDANGTVWVFGGHHGGNSGIDDFWSWNGTTWTLRGGNGSSVSQPGNMGTLGVTSASNFPPGRFWAMAAVDNSGNAWLFGGEWDNGTGGVLAWRNDLWKFDGTNWTWMAGSASTGQAGVYSGAGATPGCRANGAMWADASGKIWIFGGWGSDASGTMGTLNDLWYFSGGKWTLAGGSNGVHSSGATGIYPGARYGMSYTKDAQGNFIIFGGNGVGSDNNSGTANLADLWKLDPTTDTWTAIAGPYTSTGTNAIYSCSGGTGCTPGGRNGATLWRNGVGDLYLFGGNSNTGLLRDLWRFSGGNWTVVHGDSTANADGVYGTQGTGSSSTIPGGRENAISWLDANGNLVLFGGDGRAASTPINNISDLGDLWTIGY